MDGFQVWIQLFIECSSFGLSVPFRPSQQGWRLTSCSTASRMCRHVEVTGSCEGSCEDAAARTATPSSTIDHKYIVCNVQRRSAHLVPVRAGTEAAESTTPRLDGSVSRCLQCLPVHVDEWVSEDCNTDINERVRVHRVQTSTWIRVRRPLVREHHNRDWKGP